MYCFEASIAGGGVWEEVKCRQTKQQVTTVRNKQGNKRGPGSNIHTE